MAVFVSFYDEQGKVFETLPLVIREELEPHSKAMGLGLRVALGGVPAGRLVCQVSVVDPAGQKVAFWQALSRKCAP